MADHTYSYTCTKEISSNNLSFSSTLLEQICRSIDVQSAEEVVINSMRKKTSDNHDVFKTEEQMANYQRACMIEKWMEKKVTQKFVVPGKSMADLKVWQKLDGQAGSSCSSSDSSCGGFFSSSETDHRDSEAEQKWKHESGFLKTKWRVYGDLKKVKKQPISPGGKVTAFLNSLFNLKKTKAKSSSACLNKTKSSLKSAKLSVRFSPMVENDLQFMKSEEGMMRRRIMEENRKVAARDFLMKDQTGSCEINEFSYAEEDDDDDDFDAESCASSDLFELDNLSAIGMELPVYQTTDILKIQTMQL